MTGGVEEEEEMGEKSKQSFKQQAARASWILPIVTIVLMAVGNSAMQNSKSPLTGIIMGGVFLFSLLAGVVLGIVGCFGVRQHRAKTTILPGLIGAGLSAGILCLMLAIAIPSFLKYREASLNRATDALQRLADQTNKQLPVMADPETRVDRIAVIAPNLIEYQYTLVNAEIDQFDAEQFALEAQPEIVEYYRTSGQFKMFRENRISVRFAYYDKNGSLITNIVASPDDSSNK